MAAGDNRNRWWNEIAKIKMLQMFEILAISAPGSGSRSVAVSGTGVSASSLLAARIADHGPHALGTAHDR